MNVHHINETMLSRNRNSVENVFKIIHFSLLLLLHFIIKGIAYDENQ